MSLDPALVAAIISAGKEVAKAIWNAATHHGDHAESVEQIAKAAIAAGVEEAKERALALGLEVAFGAFDVAGKQALDAFEAKGEFPTIVDPANIEIMPADWHPPADDAKPEP